MNKPIKPARMAAMVCALVFIVLGYFVALYQLQIVEGAAYYEQSQNNIVTTHTVTAARGNVYDRYGRALITNRACNNLKINTDELFEQEDPNRILLQLVEAVQSSGDTYTDELPITREAPFEYVEDMTDTQRVLLDAYIAYNVPNGLAENPSAVELMSFFRTRYNIDNNYSSDEMRTIAGLRYELNVRYIKATAPYVFVEDASIELITRIMEQNIQGITVETSYTREYETDYAAHLLGYVGAMAPGEFEDHYEREGYSMDAAVGRSGVEYAFEKYLHGTDGEAKVTSTASGTVTGTVYTKAPQPGNHTYLTIDIGLQEAAEIALDTYITQENIEREGEIAEELLYGEQETQYIDGAAVVAIKVDSGEPLAIASWPTFDLETFLENYDELNEDPNAPMFNRALNGVYSPGSTFKPCTTLALLDTGIVTPNTTTYDEITFMKYKDAGYTPSCWIKGKGASHGEVNAAAALKYSCNYYFYTWGDLLGIDRLGEYAAQLGLGQPTGIELYEDVGRVASADFMWEVEGRDWYAGDTLAASIGQSMHQFTPIQIANYIATIANGGTRYSTSLLKSVRSYDYSENIFERTPQVLGIVESDPENYATIHQGMIDVANAVDGTGFAIFGHYPYCTVAAKTGTAETGTGSNNAVFVCFAPAEDPEIAVAVVVENGTAGSAIGVIARDVLDYYFNFQVSNADAEFEMNLLK